MIEVSINKELIDSELVEAQVIVVSIDEILISMNLENI